MENLLNDELLSVVHRVESALDELLPTEVEPGPDAPRARGK